MWYKRELFSTEYFTWFVRHPLIYRFFSRWFHCVTSFTLNGGKTSGREWDLYVVFLLRFFFHHHSYKHISFSWFLVSFSSFSPFCFVACLLSLVIVFPHWVPTIRLICEKVHINTHKHTYINIAVFFICRLSGKIHADCSQFFAAKERIDLCLVSVHMI